MRKPVWLLVFLVLALWPVSCGDKSPTNPNNCANYAGTYTGAFNNSCGGSGSGFPVTVAQAVCNFSANLGPLGAATGTVDGNNLTFTITTVCGNLSGTGTISSSAINGTYTGTSSGGAQCCPAGPLSGSFTLTR